MGKVSSAVNMFSTPGIELQERPQYSFDVKILLSKTAFCFVFNFGLVQKDDLRKHDVEAGVTTLHHRGKEEFWPMHCRRCKRGRWKSLSFPKHKFIVCQRPHTKNATFSRIFLPSASVKLHLWNEYRKICESAVGSTVSGRSFRRILDEHLKHLKIMNPRTDLRATCENYYNKIWHEKTRLVVSHHVKEPVRLGTNKKVVSNNFLKILQFWTIQKQQSNWKTTFPKD